MYFYHVNLSFPVFIMIDHSEYTLSGCERSKNSFQWAAIIRSAMENFSIKKILRKLYFANRKTILCFEFVYCTPSVDWDRSEKLLDESQSSSPLYSFIVLKRKFRLYFSIWMHSISILIHQSHQTVVQFNSIFSSFT